MSTDRHTCILYLSLSSLLIFSASTRKLYEKKLQKLLDDGPAQPPQPQLVITEIQVNHNGNSESDLYSDKEEGKDNIICKGSVFNNM